MYLDATHNGWHLFNILALRNRRYARSNVGYVSLNLSALKIHLWNIPKKSPLISSKLDDKIDFYRHEIDTHQKNN